jgi:conjugative relaxase-like TrwC/TraI family protein
VRKLDTDGFVIAQFCHRTSRSTDPATRVGDPQLHSHCTILNRIRGVDGVWRTLDSRAIYRNVHAAGAVFGATLEAELSGRLGVSWTTPARRVPMREVAGIPTGLIGRFSTRRAAVLETYEALEAQWRAMDGRTPTRAERESMKDEATIRSRLPKARGDVDLHEQWRTQTPDDELTAIATAVGSAMAPSDGGRLPAGSA